MLFSILAAACSLFRRSNVENHRRSKRFKRCTLLTLQELDDDLSPIGQTKWAMSRDVNRHGIGFVSRDQIDSTYIRVTVVEDNFSVIGIVRHSRVLPGGEALFVGVEFLDDEFCHER